MKSRKSGFTTLEILVALIISTLIINLLHSSILLLKKVDLKTYNQDLISAMQLYQIFNVSQNIEIIPDEITFKYLNEERNLRYINDKIIMTPGTVIYFTDVKDFKFYTNDEKIYLQLKRNNKKREFLIGALCDMDLS